MWTFLVLKLLSLLFSLAHFMKPQDKINIKKMTIRMGNSKFTHCRKLHWVRNTALPCTAGALPHVRPITVTRNYEEFSPSLHGLFFRFPLMSHLWALGFHSNPDKTYFFLYILLYTLTFKCSLIRVKGFNVFFRQKPRLFEEDCVTSKL